LNTLTHPSLVFTTLLGANLNIFPAVLCIIGHAPLLNDAAR
jgi:hypothetical protein